ncbi:MAG: hypothetical protein QOG32_1180 [Chloroflexota bacterium]|nr:hypothetical protein [Chloroflexota bacterium]
MKPLRAGGKVGASRLALVGLALIAASALAACGTAAAGWTYTPASATPAAPAASGSAVPSPAASGSAAASPAASASTAPSGSPIPSASGSAPSSATPSGSASTDTIGLTEWKVTMPTEVKAGMVSYTITNTGTEVHELIGFRSSLDPVAYPRQPNGDVNEEGKGITSATDGPNLDPGGTQTRTIDLTTPGRYTFMCNLPGHFVKGMYIVVTVTP